MISPRAKRTQSHNQTKIQKELRRKEQEAAIKAMEERKVFACVSCFQFTFTSWLLLPYLLELLDAMKYKCNLS